MSEQKKRMLVIEKCTVTDISKQWKASTQYTKKKKKKNMHHD